MRTTLLMVALLCLLLSGCGSAASSTAPSTSTAPSPVAAPTSAVPATLDGESAPQMPASITDYQGNLVTVESVERVVSLTGDITETIFALGLGDSLVGVDISATYPPDKVHALPNIGYQRTLNAEGILSLNPTLVIGDEFAGPPEVLEQIRAAGVPVALSADPPTLEAPIIKIQFVAEAFGVPQRGYALSELIQDSIDDALARSAQLSEAPHALFLYLRGTDIQQVAGAETPADAMITAAGGINTAADVGIVDFKPLSAETIVAAQPDVIVVLSKGLESVGGVDGLLRIPGIADTPAGQARRVIALDDLYFIGLGPRTPQALNDLADAFHDAQAVGALQ